MKRVSVVPAFIGGGSLALCAIVTVCLLKTGGQQAEAVVPTEKATAVTAITAQPEDVPVVVRGYGEAHVLKEVRVAAEVSGKVVETHPDLLVGGIIPEGEVLFAIDPRPFEAQVADAQALISQREAEIARLKAEEANERQRLGTLERSVALAKAQLERYKRLCDEGIGSSASVDDAEQNHISFREQMDASRRALALFPSRVAEAESALASAQAKLNLAEIALANTCVVAPFTARVKASSVQPDQFVTAGSTALLLADDSVLEIAVPVNSQEARKWLRFRDTTAAPGAAWFAEPERATCRIRWTEETNGHTWQGVLDRVEAYDEQSRTLTVAVRVEGAQAVSNEPDGLPLVEGMFCEVAIPGRTIQGVYRLAPSAVSLDDVVHVAVDNRLKTVPVEIVRRQDDHICVSGGLHPGDVVITTRLVNAVENMLVDAALDDEAPALADEGAAS